MMEKPPSISTEELYKNLRNDRFRIIDLRPVEAYNGWKLKNELRGGHIRNAKSLPAKWLNYIDWMEIARSKGIHPDYTLVIYGYDPEHSQKAARLFMKAGYHQVKIYEDFLDRWTVDPELPMDHLARYRQLVPRNG